MTAEEIREQFDQAIERGDLPHALKLIYQAEELGYPATAMRDIYAIHDTDSHTD